MSNSELDIKTCKKCGQTKQAMWFPKRKSVCKECRKWERKHGKITVVPAVTNNVPAERVPTIEEAFREWKL